MAFTVVVDRAVGYAPVEADWDTYVKDNMNSGVWVQLANSTLAVDTASIDFTSISGSWAHLMLECYLRGTTAASTTGILVRVNNDSAANYDYQALSGSGAATAAGETFAATSLVFGSMPGSMAGANLFSANTIIVPHYANAANNKVLINQHGVKYGTSSGNMATLATSGFWRSNSAITRVTVFPTAGNLAAGSRATLYGLP